ncbi:MAG TPA: hypothetical protein DIU15_20610 [Deltaproteobacteria bacterium]|nr:hypothetical protein [Deltaproteobacteria bacterium]HCP48451.1 hypothetical protein [Deltaproteobacteria bacterium]
MTPGDDSAFLRFLARWDRDEDALRTALAETAGRQVDFLGNAPPTQAQALFNLFERDPLDAVTQGEDESLSLPYHPWAAYRAIVEEQYLGPLKAPLHARVPLPYHLVPGGLRMLLYPLVAGRPEITPEQCPPNPSWPVEPRLDRFRRDLFEGMAGGHQAPKNPWPGGKRFALLMTHDVDTRRGLAASGTILEEMAGMGLKPCFFLVGRGYKWDDGFCDAVRQAGGEIGLHGDTHDNRIAFETAARAGNRLDSCQDRIQRHGIRGFRSPSLLVSDALYTAVGTRFAWDSSVPDTDTHTLIGPRRGCATVFPFRRQQTLVLPTTMPADDRLQLLGYEGMDFIAVLRRKWEHVRSVGGLCHFLTHPEPHLFGRRVLRDLYRALLDEILDAGDAWIATPSMVAKHWRGLEDPASSSEL